MTTIYRQYRPQTFKDLVGQNHVKLTLSHEIETGRLAHAYLFCGPRGIGKTTIARVFAKSVNCETRKEGEHEPCNKCLSCLDITSGKSIDIVEIDAASHTGVDNVRENIIAFSRVSPSKSKYKVFIIDEVHMLSISAFNALLKVLEEPPANVIFILCTTEVHKIPATIISRCQRFDLKRISMADIVRKLQFIAVKEDIKIDKSILESIARQSEGHMRDAESLFGQIVSIGGKEITSEEADLVIPRSALNEVLDLISYLVKKDAVRAITLINNLVDEGMSLKKFTVDLVEILRKMLLAKISPALSDKLGLDLGESMEMKFGEINKNTDITRIVVFLDAFLGVKKDLKDSFIVQLPYEIAIAKLCADSPRAQAPVFGGPRPVEPQKKPIPATQTEPRADYSQKEAAAPLDKETLASKWKEVLAKVKQYNHSLSFILRVCQPKDINGNQLCLAFKYKFHRDRLNDISIKSMVEKILNEVYGRNLVVEAVIDETLVPDKEEPENAPAAGQAAEAAPEAPAPSDPGEENDIMKNLLKNFGGRVVG